jgi:hypothetical protein
MDRMLLKLIDRIASAQLEHVQLIFSHGCLVSSLVSRRPRETLAAAAWPCGLCCWDGRGKAYWATPTGKDLLGVRSGAA